MDRREVVLYVSDSTLVLLLMTASTTPARNNVERKLEYHPTKWASASDAARNWIELGQSI